VNTVGKGKPDKGKPVEADALLASELASWK